MTAKDVKQWLWRARGIDAEIKSLMKTRAAEFDRVTAVTAQLGGSTVSGTKDPHKFDHLSELDDTILRRINELEGVKAEVLTKINLLEDIRYRKVLKMYYVDCMTLEQIAVEMRYSFQHVAKLKYDAINILKDKKE